MKLQEALLRRKELTGKVEVLSSINERALFEVRCKRINVTENVDEVTANVPKLTASQVMAEFNFYARQLRQIDAIIQQANWTTEVDADKQMEEYVESEKKSEEASA